MRRFKTIPWQSLLILVCRSCMARPCYDHIPLFANHFPQLKLTMDANASVVSQ
jgi:hypothetical protein